MTVPAALPAPALLTGLGAPEGTQEAPATDAFAVLLAALAGGVVVPVPAQPPALGPEQEPDAGTPTAPVTATGVAAIPPGPAASPVDPAVVWEATTQRTLVTVPDVAPGGSTAPTPTAAAGPAPADHEPAAPQVGAVGVPVEAATSEALPADEDAVAPAAEPLHAELPAAAPPVTSLRSGGLPEATAAPVSAPSATAPAAPAMEVTGAAPASSAHRVQPSLLEAVRGLREEGGGRTSLVVRLDPPELGAVVVRLTVQDGRVDVQLRTPDLTARADLQAQAFDVQRVLRDNGLDLTSFDVSHGDVASGGRDDARTPDRGTPQRHGPADGRTGTSLVTDDVTDPQAAGTWL